MIFHGDPGREESIDSIVASIRDEIERASGSEAEGIGISCEALRRALIRAGELEQAVFDSPSSLGSRDQGRRLLRALRAATSLAASAFHHACEPDTAGRNGTILVREALAGMRRALERFPNGNGFHGRVWVKSPTGFASRAVFPEGYREAARRWAADHGSSTERDVLVVGIRSIGTTLSAVVAATLRAGGWRARRITVRPKGHPFARHVRLNIRPAEWGLIVDDGPGPSGSSVVAVADALARAGVARIHVFPAHNHGPGPLSGEQTRARWKEYPTYCSPLEELQIGGRSLPESLWSSIDRGHEDPLARVVSIGGGAWRSLHYATRSDWPAVCRAFERPKLLCEGASGRRILFKFAGLAMVPGSSSCVAEMHARRLATLAVKGWTPGPLGTAHGFVAMEWLDGRPLTSSDASPDLLRRIGGYIAAAAGPPLSMASARAARNRLETMLCVNAREALGDEAANAALGLVRPVPAIDLPRCGDGHLAPHEWIATADGRVVKTDAGGHELDPTWTGRQPVLWDLAGAMLEWDLDDSGGTALLDGFAAAGGGRSAPVALDAYRAAYAAHRIGQIRHGMDVETDPEERARLERDHERWRDALAMRLGQLSAASGRL